MAVKTVQAIINGQTYELKYNSSSGKYEGTVTAPSITSFNVNAAHYYPVQIKAVDQAGNVTTKDDGDSSLGANLKLVVKETTKPTIVINSPSSGARVVTSTPAIKFLLRDENNGSGINISSLKLKVDGGTAVTNSSKGMVCIKVNNGYDCTYTCPTLKDGAHTIIIDISDNDMNTANTVNSTFTIDTVPPALNINDPFNGLITNNNKLTVNGSTDDTTSKPVTVTVKLNGTDQGTTPLSNGTFSKELTLAQGNNTIVIRAQDAAGLYTEITRTVTLDTTPPVIDNVVVTPNPTNTGSTFTITVTVSD